MAVAAAAQRPAHPSSDLTDDHVVPLAAGGAPFDIGNSAVLCRSCSSTRRARRPTRARSDRFATQSCPDLMAEQAASPTPGAAAMACSVDHMHTAAEEADG